MNDRDWAEIIDAFFEYGREDGKLVGPIDIVDRFEQFFQPHFDELIKGWSGTMRSNGRHELLLIYTAGFGLGMGGEGV